MILSNTIKVELSNPYPSSQEVTTHELNYGGTRFLNVEFYNNSQAVSFTGVTVTATIVCNGCLVVEDSDDLSVADNVVSLNISSTENYTILPGRMLIEFKFDSSTQQTHKLYPSTAVVVNVNPSIVDDAQVTPESYGTVSEILKEVANARGTYNSLGERLDDILPITGAKIATGTIETTNIGIGQVQTANIDGGAVTSDKLGIKAVETININDNAVTSAKLGIEAVEEINIDSGAVTTSRIADEAITYEKLDVHSLLNTSTTSQPIYDDEHLPTTQFMKNYLTNRLCGKYSISFNSDNSIKNAESVTSLSVGSSLGGAGVRSVYVSPTVNSINGSYASSTPDLKVLYVDKRADEITIDDYIKTDPHINIYYQGEFSIIDLIIESLMATVSVISQVNTQLENAINGVSE